MIAMLEEMTTEELTAQADALELMASGISDAIHVGADALFHRLLALLHERGLRRDDPAFHAACVLYEEALDQECAGAPSRIVAGRMLHGALFLVSILDPAVNGDLHRAADLHRVAVRDPGRPQIAAEAILYALKAAVAGLGNADRDGRLLADAERLHRDGLDAELLPGISERIPLIAAERFIAAAALLVVILRNGCAR